MLPTWVARTQVLGPSGAAFPGALAGGWIGSREAGTQIWDGSLVSDGLSCCAKKPALGFLFIFKKFFP